jgi:dihydropyrimidinase
MAQLDLVIRNGTVVTAGDIVRCDVGVKDGRIAVLGRNLDATETVDAADKLVLPGGVDAHVHVDEPPFEGVLNVDDFRSATRSAACGGTTTIVPFVRQEEGKGLRQSVNAYHGKADGNALIDYAFHLMITDTSDQVLGQELPALVEDGYSSFKIYMTYEGFALNDRQILEVLATARRSGAMVMIHAENDHCIHWLAKQLSATGDTSLAQFPKMAPMPVEREATHRAITLAEIVDVPILLVHVSAREALEQIKWGRDRGLKVYGETCPQYLLLTKDHIARPAGRAPSICARRRRAMRAMRMRCGTASRTASSRCCRPTIARSSSRANRARRRMDPTRISARWRPACPASRRACRWSSPKASARGASISTPSSR